MPRAQETGFFLRIDAGTRLRLALGLLEVLTAAYADVLTGGYVTSGLKEAVPFLILVLVLWIRPSGLFGRAVTRRA